MNHDLTGQKVAILVADGFEQDELLKPQEALVDAGATTEVVSPCDSEVKGKRHNEPGRSVMVDVPLRNADPAKYDVLLLPGGVQNPDTLRMDEGAVRFVKSFFEAHKPVAAICHGPWTLVEADEVRGRRGPSSFMRKNAARSAVEHFSGCPEATLIGSEHCAHLRIRRGRFTGKEERSGHGLRKHLRQFQTIHRDVAVSAAKVRIIRPVVAVGGD